MGGVVTHLAASQHTYVQVCWLSPGVVRSRARGHGPGHLVQIDVSHDDAQTHGTAAVAVAQFGVRRAESSDERVQLAATAAQERGSPCLSR